MASPAVASASSLLQYLPAIYHEERFLGQFLLAFEKILLGRLDNVAFPKDDANFAGQGLEECVAGVAKYFDPYKTPDEFLPWLASWTAFSLRADLDVTKQRQFIAKVAQLYRWRGTKKNLQDLLSIFTVGIPTVVEEVEEVDRLQIGVRSTVGRDMVVGGAHFFQVKIRLPRITPEIERRQRAIAHALIDLEKPAHTFYKLEAIFPSMRIGRHSTVGIDTLLGTDQAED